MKMSFHYYKVAIVIVVFLLINSCVTQTISDLHPTLDIKTSDESEKTLTSTSTITPTIDYRSKKVLFFVSGLLGDVVFFDQVLKGIEQAQDEYEFQLETVVSGLGVNKILPAFNETVANKDFDIMILAGQDIAYSIQTIAPKYPDRKFILIDGTVDYWHNSGLENVYCLQFDINQAAYLAGLYAGYMTQETSITGINEEEKIGVMVVKLSSAIDLLISQFRSGARYAGVNDQVIFEDINDYEDPNLAKQVASSLYAQGVDIIIDMTGKAFLGVYQAAHDAGRFVIGIEADRALNLSYNHSDLVPTVLTSVIKNHSGVTHQILSRAINQTLNYGKPETLGLSDHAFILVKDNNFNQYTSAAIQQKLKEFEENISNPRIIVFMMRPLEQNLFYNSVKSGLQKAEADFGVRTQIVGIGPKSTNWDSDIRGHLEEGQFDIVVTMDNDLIEPIVHLAGKFPHQKFIILNGTVNYSIRYLPNIISLKFNQNDAIYLAGYYAGLMTQTVSVEKINQQKVVGILGGMSTILINNRIEAFKQGAIAAGLTQPEILIDFCHSFSETNKCYEKANEMFNKGADIIYHLAGNAGTGVFHAAREFGVYGIGTDYDQEEFIALENPELATVVLTSVDMDRGKEIYILIDQILNNRLNFGEHIDLGLSSEVVGLVKSGNYEALTPENIKSKIEEIETEIISGQIQVIPDISD